MTGAAPAPSGKKRRLAALFLLSFGGCATLPDMAAGQCGNGVVEPPEDCDSHAPDASSVCRARGTAGECHLDCRPRSDGSRPACPGGWGCDRDGICRAPTGEFDGPSPPAAVGAWSLSAGDFDGDGRTDLMGRDPLDASGAAKLRFHYFDEAGALADTRLFPKLVLSPQIADVSGDGKSDLVFSDGRLGAMLGRVDRNWVPETFSSYRITGASARMTAIYDNGIQGVTAILALTTIGGVPAFYTPDFNNGGVLRVIGPLAGAVDDLMGDPASGNVIEDPMASPCREVVFAFRGADTFSVFDSCIRDPVTGQVQWRETADQLTIALDPKAPIDAAVQLVDMNGDGHLDVLVGASGRAYVSYGDGRQLSVATPYRLLLVAPDEVPPDITMPLAAGDFTGDGLVDFVFDRYLLVSQPAPAGGLPSYALSHASAAPRWTVAMVADLNGNGKPDVVAASNRGLDVDFFNGTGAPFLTAFSLPTNGPVEHLAIGDFDGDLVNDLGFIQTAVAGQDRDSIMVAFGTLARPPLAPVTVAQVRHAEQLSVYSQDGVGNLMVCSSEAVNGQTIGAVTLLNGGGDRIPFAPYELSTFASDGSVQSSLALSLSVGRFTGQPRVDVLALAVEATMKPLRFWLLPAQDGPERSPRPLDDVLDPALEPYPGEFDFHVNLASAAGDLEKSGRDVALFAMPAENQEHCGIVIAGLPPFASPRLARRDTILLDEPCERPELLPVDADGDGWLDIALLTGAPGNSPRKILVLWNDGHGQFTSGNRTVVSPSDQSPQAFTVLVATPARPLSFAYVTDQAAALVSTTAALRQFSEARVLSPLAGGTGIVAADVNGDGVLDLALAASGSLTILKAQLAIP